MMDVGPPCSSSILGATTLFCGAPNRTGSMGASHGINFLLQRREEQSKTGV